MIFTNPHLFASIFLPCLCPAEPLLACSSLCSSASICGFQDDVCFCSYGTERMRQKLLVVVTGGLVKVITPLMLLMFVS